MRAIRPHHEQEIVLMNFYRRKIDPTFFRLLHLGAVRSAGCPTGLPLLGRARTQGHLLLDACGGQRLDGALQHARGIERHQRGRHEEIGRYSVWGLYDGWVWWGGVTIESGG